MVSGQRRENPVSWRLNCHRVAILRRAGAVKRCIRRRSALGVLFLSAIVPAPLAPLGRFRSHRLADDPGVRRV